MLKMLGNEGLALYEGIPGPGQACASHQGFYGEYEEDLLYQIFRQKIKHFLIYLALLCFLCSWKKREKGKQGKKIELKLQLLSTYTIKFQTLHDVNSTQKQITNYYQTAWC